MQSPFLTNPNSSGGKLFFESGQHRSEDVLRDGRRYAENGLNTPNIPASIDSTTAWGLKSGNLDTGKSMHSAMTRVIRPLPGRRGLMDWIITGTNQIQKITCRNWPRYLERGSAIYQNASRDPSTDDFLNYQRCQLCMLRQTVILGRYKQVNNPQGTSPVATLGQQYVSALRTAIS